MQCEGGREREEERHVQLTLGRGSYAYCIARPS